jgi:hypothetical protein
MSVLLYFSGILLEFELDTADNNKVFSISLYTAKSSQLVKQLAVSTTI